MLARVAAVTAAGIDLLIVLFQIALIAGAPWGQLGRVGWGPLSGRRRLSTGLTWAALIYSLLGFGMNLASPSSLERAVWAPVCLILAACAAMVLAGTQRRRPNAK